MDEHGEYEVEFRWKEEVVYWEGDQGFLFDGGWGTQPHVTYVPDEDGWELLPTWLASRRAIVLDRLRRTEGHVVTEDAGYAARWRTEPEDLRAREMRRSGGPVVRPSAGVMMERPSARRTLQRHAGVILNGGLALAAVGAFADLNPWRLVILKSGSLGLYSIGTGAVLLVVGFASGIGRFRVVVSAVGLVLSMCMVVALTLVLFVRDSLSTNVSRTEFARGPHAIELRAREETPASDVCYSLELLVGSGLLRRSRDVVQCESRVVGPLSFEGDLASVVIDGTRCLYRVDQRHMELRSVDPQSCRDLPRT
jgi:hypothetical protein